MTETPPEGLTDWHGDPWSPGSRLSAAHPNARFTVAATQCPVIDPVWQDPQGVPISGIIFGGRSSSTVPLVYEALNWQHGVFVGASVSSETTAAAAGGWANCATILLRCSPSAATTWGIIFPIGSKWERGRPSKLPRVFHVNWFRKKQGQFIWPGFGDNVRILKWMFERIDGKVEAQETPIGLVPRQEDMDLSGLKLKAEDVAELFAIDRSAWKDEIAGLKEYFKQFGESLPRQIVEEIQRL